MVQNNNNKWGIGVIVFVIVISLCVLMFAFKSNLDLEPSVVYTVYLDGKSIGTIESKDSFEEYINNKE